MIIIFLNNIDQVRGIEWGNTHHWDVMFTIGTPYNELPPPPYPFNTWFPAIGVEENLATLSSFPIETSLSNTTVPQRSTAFTISLTFYDDVNHTLARWISNWINIEIFNNGNAVSPVSDIVRMMVFVKYQIIKGFKVPIGVADSFNPLVSGFGAVSNLLNPLGIVPYGFKAYYVYPDTTLNYTGDSESGVPTYTVQFNICGDTKLSAEPSKRANAVGELARQNSQLFDK